MNTTKLGDHDIAIKDAGEVSDAIIERFGDMFKEVRAQSKKTGDQL